MLIRSALSGVGLGLAAHISSQLVEPPFVTTIRLHVFGFIGLTGWLWKGQGLKLFHALLASMTLSTAYIFTLASSIAVYRLILHRLRSFSGDTIHALTMLSWVQIDWQGRRPLYIRAMHAKYGLIVRIGPRELSIADCPALEAMNGPSGAKCLKGPWYSSLSATPASTSLQSEMSPSRHAVRRERWKEALHSISIDEWNEKIASTAEVLFKTVTLASANGSPIDIAGYLTKFSLDCASLLAVGTSLNLLNSAEVPPMIVSLEERTRLLDTVGHLPYLMEAVRLIPSSSREFDRWISSAVQSRIREEKGNTRITTLVDGLKDQPIGHLVSDASFFITHSNDAIRRTLLECIRQLVKHPLLSDRLVKELQDVFGEEKADDCTSLRDRCPFLNACISEALRLFPPIPNGVQLETPLQGLRVSEKLHIPGNVIISVPTYTLQRDRSNFSLPDEFDPTRWLPSESKADNHQLFAYNPFGSDSMGCIGRELALMQCRLILAGMFQSFTVSLDDSSVASDSNCNQDDCIYTLASTPCMIKLVRR